MRVISQDGTYDLPYEQTAIAVYGAEITGYSLDNTRYCTLARYSTKEKAIKAMEMCRKQYAQCEFNKTVIPRMDANLAKISLEYTGKVKNEYAGKYIFKFPADEEV